MRYVVALLAFPLVVIAALALGPAPGAAAEGPCGTSHDAMDAAEFELLSRIQEYRDANLANSSPLTPSGPLIRAASWFAEHAAGRPHDFDKLHIDAFERDFADRALDCGWPEVVDIREGGVFSASLHKVTEFLPYKDFEVPDEAGQPPLHCVGIGHSTVGDVTLWVWVIASYEGDCPEPQLPPEPELSVAENPGDDEDSFLSSGLALSLGLGLLALVGVAAVVGMRIRSTGSPQGDGHS